MLPLVVIGHEGRRLLVVLSGGRLLRDLIGGAAGLIFLKVARILRLDPPGGVFEKEQLLGGDWWWCGDGQAFVHGC